MGRRIYSCIFRRPVRRARALARAVYIYIFYSSRIGALPVPRVRRSCFAMRKIHGKIPDLPWHRFRPPSFSASPFASSVAVWFSRSRRLACGPSRARAGRSSLSPGCLGEKVLCAARCERVVSAASPIRFLVVKYSSGISILLFFEEEFARRAIDRIEYYLIEMTFNIFLTRVRDFSVARLIARHTAHV